MRKKIEIEVPGETQESVPVVNVNPELDNLLTHHSVASEAANRNLDSIPWGNRPSAEIAVAAAKDKLNIIEGKILNLLIPQNVCALFLEGDTSGFNKLETVEGGVLFKADGLYTGIAEQIEFAIDGRRRFSVDNWQRYVDLLSRAQREACPEEYYNFTTPEYQDAHVPTTKSLVNHIRKLSQTTVGNDILCGQLKQAVVKQTVANKLTSLPVVVIITGATKEEQTALAKLFNTTKTQTINSNDKITNLLKG
jgi:hypothetical protein